MSLPAHHAAAADRARRSAQLIVRGMALNAVLAFGKVAGGLLGGAYALVADGVESMCDIGISVLSLAGVRWAAQPPDKNHPYGHGKAEAIAALLTAVIVLGASFGVGWHALAEIHAPGRVPAWWTLLILACAVTTKILLSRRMGEEGKDTESTALGAEAWHHLSDALTSAAAFVGITVAVLGGARFAAADGWAALAASGVIAFNGIRIFLGAVNEAMDIAVPERLEKDVRRMASGVAGVASLHKCRVRKSGTSYLVDIEIRVSGDLSVRDGHGIAHAVKDTLLGSRLRVSDVIVHVEPS